VLYDDDRVLGGGRIVSAATARDESDAQGEAALPC
jgi:hypothetical protein